MTETTAPPLTAPPERATVRSWLAVAALTAATFAITATEMLPVGLLTPLGDSLRISEGSAGLTVTLTGIVAALAAPVVPLAVGRLDRRLSIAGLMLVLAAANAVSAVATSLTVLLTARVLVGVALGGVWALAASLAVRLVPARSVSTALSAVFGGIGIASVLAVPAGTMLGELAGWRSAFGAACGLALLVAAALALLLPPLPPEKPVRPRELLRLFGNPKVRAGLIFLVLVVTGHFAAYTYVRPVLENISGIAPGLIGVLLLAYGVAGVAGNFAAGAFAPRRPLATLLTLSAGIAAATVLLVAAGSATPFAVAVLLLWGVAYGGLSVSAQAWMLASAPEAREPVGALFASVFNAAIALGAFTGGRVVDTTPLSTVLLLAAALAACALTVLALTGRGPGGEAPVTAQPSAR
ncbi:MFS transporter [Streptomyces iconiensis]|uniref:MFS transporter n=1 Tax=Streptomyces iconiensis TaxID=1384038 RepID=A0ABT7A0H4_9ACTN|nr:MFS transporter [Streptomyces iconiensis]MDJ1134824.1 MFS transporter [Streptomyces iconiensis]